MRIDEEWLADQRGGNAGDVDLVADDDVRPGQRQSPTAPQRASTRYLRVFFFALFLLAGLLAGLLVGLLVGLPNSWTRSA